MHETETEKWRRRGFQIVNGNIVPRGDIAGIHKKAVALALRPEPLSSPFGAQNAQNSPLNSKFDACWASLQGPQLEKEVMLVPGKKFRSDYFHEDSRIAIELEGFGPGHTSIAGFRKDAVKYLSETLQGITVCRLTSDMITEEWLTKIIKLMNKRTPQETSKHVGRKRHE